MQLTKIRLTLLVALALGLLIASPLWLNHAREFPLIQATSWLPALAAPFDTVRLVLLFAAITLAIVRPKWVWPVAVTLTLLLWIGLEDRVRWQPWPYQYALCLLPFLFQIPAANLRIQRIVLVAIYLWGGLHKLTPAFPRLYEGTLAKSMFEAAGDSWLASVLRMFGHTAAPLEIAIAVLLAIPNQNSRKAACILAAALHLTILVWFSLDGRNIVVWPWNLAMAALVYFAFWPKEKPDTAKPDNHPKLAHTLTAAIAALTLLCPALALRNQWPVYFSFKLYSGQGQRLLATFTNPAALERIPPGLAKYAKPSPHQKTFHEIYVQVWAESALRVALPADDAVVLGAAKHIARETGLSASDLFFYRDYPLLLKERGFATYRPDQVLEFESLPPLRP